MLKLQIIPNFLISTFFPERFVFLISVCPDVLYSVLFLYILRLNFLKFQEGVQWRNKMKIMGGQNTINGGAII